MRFRCPYCFYIITTDEYSRGYPVQCAGCGKTVMAPVSHFDLECVVGDFVINAKIGAGAIGTVYRATQLSLDRTVALKILSPEYTNSRGLNDFLKEARAAAKLNHTNLMQSYAVGEEEGTCYMAMTYIDGESIKSRLGRENKIPVDESLHIIQQVAEALYYVWDEAGMVHRDVKPDNIMVTSDGIVKLTDLGLAMSHTEWRENMEIDGSPSYMSPEQLFGGKLDTRTDIYSLGITLYQMISGRLPFVSSSVQELAEMHYSATPPPLKSIAPEVPSAVEHLIRRMIAKDPDDRFKDMDELLRSIWTIRQKTAPNKTLIPAVHTISMKRLDYEIQENPEAASAVREPSPVNWKIWRERMYGAGAAAILCIVIFGVILMAFPRRGGSIGNGQRNPEAEHRIGMFERLLAEHNIDREQLIDEGRRIIAELEPYSSVPEYGMRILKIKTSVSEMELAKKKSELERAGYDAYNLRKDLRHEKSVNEGLTIRVTELTKRLAAVSDTQKMYAKIVELNNLMRNITAERDSFQQKCMRLNERLQNLQKNIIRKKVTDMQLAGSFGEVESLISVWQIKNPALFHWLEKKAMENAIAAKTYSLLAESGRRFEGMSFSASGASKILEITEGVVRYKDAAGSVAEANWKNIDASAALAIMKKDNRLSLPDSRLSSIFHLISGRLGKACALDPENTELQDSVGACGAYDIEFLKIRAESEAVPDLEKEISGIMRTYEGCRDYNVLKRETEKLRASMTSPGN